jgi:hypothetical protein
VDLNLFVFVVQQDDVLNDDGINLLELLHSVEDDLNDDNILQERQMVDMVHERNDCDDDDGEDMDNKYVEIVNVFQFDDIEELVGNNMDKVQKKILDDLLDIDLQTKNKLIIKLKK